MKITAIIPARYASSRFPGKPITNILKRPMIEWVYNSISQSTLIDKVIIATDDSRIFNKCKSFTSNVVMTDIEHKSGTDRIAEIAKNLDSDLIINVQGDEPLVTYKILEKLIDLMLRNPQHSMGTLAKKLNKNDMENTNVVKVLIDNTSLATNFFRKVPIQEAKLFNISLFAHIGIYAYKRDFLLKFHQLNSSPGEKKHSLEQLRAIENGFNIGIGLVEYNGFGVDTIEDLKKVEEILRKKG